MVFFEFADGLITRVTDFWPEPYEPPPGREHLVERWLPAPAQRGLTQPHSRAHAESAEPAEQLRRHSPRTGVPAPPFAANRVSCCRSCSAIGARTAPGGRGSTATRCRTWHGPQVRWQPIRSRASLRGGRAAGQEQVG